MSKEMIKNIIRSRQVLWSLSLAQLKSRYAGTMFGIYWTIINPLLMMFAINFVFSQILKSGQEHFSFFILSGIIPWMFFSGALSEAANSLLNQQNMMRQFSFPLVVLPLASVLTHFINFLIGWGVMYPIFLIANPKIMSFAHLVPLILFLHLCLVAGFCLALSVLNVYFRDIGQLLGMVLMFWFWVTPVFYTIEMVPTQFLWMYDINPAAPFIVLYQKIIFEAVLPSPVLWAQTLTYALVSVCVGLVIFIKLESGIPKKI